MATLFVTHQSCIDHDTGPGHPEQSDRLRVIQRVLEAEEFMFLHREEAPKADLDLIKKVHDPAYVDRVMAAIPQSGYESLDGDTYVSPASGEAALRLAVSASRSMRSWPAMNAMPLSAYARRDIMRNMTGRWGSACLTMWRSVRVMPAMPMASNVWR